MLQIIVFAILMGVAVTHSGDRGKQVLSFFESFNEVVMTMVSFLMHLAPYGVFCLLAKLFSELGITAIAEPGQQMPGYSTWPRTRGYSP